MKKFLSVITGLMMLMTFCVPVSYADGSRSYSFIVKAAGGAESVSVKPGEVFDVELVLKRTDDTDGYMMYAAGCILSYNTDFFTLVSEPSCDEPSDKGISIITGNKSADSWQPVTVSVKSPDFEGVYWENAVSILHMQLKAEQPGASVLQIKNAAVGTISGSHYPTESSGVTVTVSNSDKNSESADSGKDTSGSSQGSGSSGNAGSGSSASAGSSGGGSLSDTQGNSSDNKEPVSDNQNGASQHVSLSFTDVGDSDWYSEAVAYVTGKGLFTGTGENTFSPDAGMSRAMLVTVLWRMEGSPGTNTAGKTFTDVPSGTWYSSAVSWAAENGIVSGISKDSFAPSRTVTREQLAAMLYRYASYTESDISASGNLEKFTDRESIGSWARQAVSWAVDKGIINGMTADTIAPAASSTRAQVAAMLMRYSKSTGL